MTIHAAKRSEFPAAIVSVLDQVPHPIERDAVRDSYLLYVRLTRAMGYMIVTWTGTRAFTDRVQGSSEIVAMVDQ